MKWLEYALIFDPGIFNMEDKEDKKMEKAALPPSINYFNTLGP
jgi:hypothetical protein